MNVASEFIPLSEKLTVMSLWLIIVFMAFERWKLPDPSITYAILCPIELSKSLLLLANPAFLSIVEFVVTWKLISIPTHFFVIVFLVAE